MKILVRAAAILIASQVLALSASAQDKSRAEVKAEAASAVKAGEIPRGEAQDPKAEPRRTVGPAEKAAARSKRKTDAAAAIRAGSTEKGEATVGTPVVKTTPQERAAARAKRKAETASAVKAGEVPRGEAATTGK